MDTKLEKLYSPSRHLEAHPKEMLGEGLVWSIYRSDDQNFPYGVYKNNFYTPGETYCYTEWEVGELANLLGQIRTKLTLDKPQKDIMSYNILEARIEFKDNAVSRVTVLVEISKGDIRAIFATTKPSNGYMHIPPGAKVTNDLLQEVAGYGRETVDRDEIFPGIRR